MRKTIYNVFQSYNHLVPHSDKAGNPFTIERRLDEMESIMDAFIYGKENLKCIS